MPKIEVLDDQTIDQIAAGEVVERPSSVVKELVENAVDAGATAVTVEIRDGGTSMIRVTDNGCGIEQDQIRIAFFRHSTSKLRKIEDLAEIASLGFRGEALSSIASVAQVELITKTPDAFAGSHYLIEGGKDTGPEEVGAPKGTTFLVRNLFYNTPARKKFLKSAQTEGACCSDLMEHMALSHPEVSFKFISGGQIRLHTSGSGEVKDVIYHIYGREIASNLLAVKGEFDAFSVNGYIGKPSISRGNRNYENYFINGRYIKSKLIAKAIEDAYHGFLMQHKYPFVVLNFTIDGKRVDVNVHPNKMELRFSDGEEIYSDLVHLLESSLRGRDLIGRVTPGKEEKTDDRPGYTRRELPEPFEESRLDWIRASVRKDSPYEKKYERSAKQPVSGMAGTNMVREELSFAAQRGPSGTEDTGQSVQETNGRQEKSIPGQSVCENKIETVSKVPVPEEQKKEAAYEKNQLVKPTAGGPGSDALPTDRQKEDAAENCLPGSVVPETQSPQAEASFSGTPVQMTLAQAVEESLPLLAKDARPKHRIIGQLFATYWLVEYRDTFYMIDQHAAHEKVLYERTMKAYREKEFTSQMISPPIILPLTMQEELLLKKYWDSFEKLGFVIEPFGGKEYAIRAVPGNLYGLNGQTLITDLIDGLGELSAKDTPELVVEKIASMSCKAAVKGNQKLSDREISQLIDDLMELENPYFCPHGRPVILAMTKQEIERKFKRIV